MFERTRVGGALFTISDRSGGDAHDRQAIKALTDPFIDTAVQDVKKGLKVDQAAATLVFRVVNHFHHENFLEPLYQKNFEAFGAFAKVYVSVFAMVSNNNTYFSHALSHFSTEAHSAIQSLVLNAPSN